MPANRKKAGALNAKYRTWCLRTPVVPADFQSLFDNHKHLAVQCSLQKIEQHGFFEDPIPNEELLHVDLQTDPVASSNLRLGSGRSGFYKGHYLKGIGRTPLTGQWNDIDFENSSGHLCPSFALREMLVSRYLIAKGGAEVLNGCEGLLVRNFDGARKKILRQKFNTRPRDAAWVDFRFQCISVKKGNFARYSNFCWLLDNQFASEEDFHSFFIQLSNYLTPDSANGVLTTPTALSRKIRENNAVTIKRFLRTTELGVYWTAFHNNFTLDGRFLDLEVPLVFGHPFLGNMYSFDLQRERYFPHCGFELIYVLYQIKSYLNYFVFRIKFTLDHMPEIRGRMRVYAEEFCEEVESILNERDSVFALDGISEILIEFFDQKLGVAPKHRDKLLTYIKKTYGFIFLGKAGIPSLKTKSVKETFGFARPFAIEELKTLPLDLFNFDHTKYKDAELFSALLLPLERQTNIAKFMDELHNALKTLDSEVKPIPKSKN